MKRATVIILLALAMLFVVEPAQAQQTMNPNGQKTFYLHTLASAKAYANSQVDSLPNYAANPTTITAGGSSALALEFSVADTASGSIVLQYTDGFSSTGTIKSVGLGTFTCTSSSGFSHEYPIRNSAVDELGGTLSGKFWFIITFDGSGNGNGGKPATKKYTAKLAWKP